MLENLQNLVTFQKIQLDNLVDFEKCCKTRIFLQKSVPIQPKTSNILPKFCQKLATNTRVSVAAGTGTHFGAVYVWLWGSSMAARPEKLYVCNATSPHLKMNFRKFCKFLAGSFSAVSKRNFARKYAFDSIFQALQDLRPFAPLQSQNFRKKSV